MTWRSFFVRYQDRILFGTDNGYDAAGSVAEFAQRTAQHVAEIRRFLETDDSFSARGRQDWHGLKLDRAILAKIYSGNFCRRIPATPKPVNLDQARAYCDWLWQQYQMSSPDSSVPTTVKARLEYVRRGLEALP